MDVDKPGHTVPAGHTEHVVAPRIPENVDAGHAVQEDTPEETLLNVPATQRVHTDWLAIANAPIGQTVGEDEFKGQKNLHK